MSNKITKHPDLIRKENKVKDLQKQLKKRKTTLKSLKTRLSNTKKEIEDISRTVQSQVMEKLTIIDKLRMEIADLARQLKKSKNISREDKEALAGMAEDLASEDILGEGYEEYKAHKEKLETGDFDFDEEQRAKMRDIFQQYQVKPPEEEQRNIRKIFLKLSQKFHPDRAKTKKEEASFHSLMQQINEAYQNNDIHTLLELERMYLTEELDFDHQSITMDVLEAAIQRLEKEIKFINNQINRTSAEIKNLRQSDMGQMLTAVNKAEREGEGLDEMDKHNSHVIEVFTKLRDGLKDSIEKDAISPILLDLMMSDMGGGLGEDMDAEDLMSMMGMMADDEGDIFDIFGGGFEEDTIENPTFPIDSSVRVSKNVKNIFYKKTNMKGWEGRVVNAYYDEEDEAVYVVEFDSITLKQMPDKLVKMAIDDLDEFEAHAFYEHQLEASQARDSEMDTFKAHKTILNRVQWQYLPKAQAERIQAVLLANLEYSDEDNWVVYLQQHLNFPFKAKTIGFFEDRGIPAGLRCEVFHLKFFDEDAGHIVIVQPQGMSQQIPHALIDLKLIKGSSKMKEVLSDYQEWADMVL